jgi:hypothetical protein
MEFFTIGVFNSTEEEFFNKLVQNKIDTFCDVRQRRGVRGAKYSFVNHNRLQQRLNELDIKYGHILSLAPTEEIRSVQKQADLDNKEIKTERQKLSNFFIFEYQDKILDKFDFGNFVDKLEEVGASRIVLFCVEENPEACHRSLVAERLGGQYNYKITHL